MLLDQLILVANRAISKLFTVEKLRMKPKVAMADAVPL